MIPENTAYFRFYAELNDFLPPKDIQKTFEYRFTGKPSVKDSIEAIGIPHTEVDLILANGQSAGFDYLLRNGDFLSVYPVFKRLDISGLNRFRFKPPRETRFILDVHLGKLAKYLRLFGFDCLYRKDFEDREIIGIALKENQIILTRDIGLLKNRAVTHGYWVRNIHLEDQLKEVFIRFNLTGQIKIFSRCLECNGELKNVPKEKVIDRLQPNTRKYYQIFFQCSGCGKVY